jgi:ribonuclease G
LSNTLKYIKDNINDEVEEIILADEDLYEELKIIIKNINKDYLSKLKLEKNKDVFDLYKVSKEIEKALNKKVWLKSGGYLIIEKTEALTVVDVNTGKFVGNIELDETIYKTNKEALVEIARQLRLRDIGGIIIIDFIDMNKKEYKLEVLKLLNLELKKEKRQTEVLGMTKLGLVEVTRRREKDSIDKYYLSINSFLDDIEKEIIRIKEHTSYKKVLIQLNDFLYKNIKNDYNYIIEDISKKYGISISLEADYKIESKKFNIIFNS